MLSDLMVSPTARRQGIAKQLVQICEETCIKYFHKNQLFIRVEETNIAAINMYKQLNYKIIDNPGDPDEIILLCKQL